MLCIHQPLADQTMFNLLPSGKRLAAYFFAVVLLSRVREASSGSIMYIMMSASASDRIECSLSVMVESLVAPLTMTIFLVMVDSFRVSMILLWSMSLLTGHPVSGLSFESSKS